MDGLIGNHMLLEETTTYKKTRGGITGHGQRYEVNVAFWLLLKGLQLKNQFYLGSNVDGFGNFDDICFKYKRNDEWHLLLVQLKHKQQTTLDTHFIFDKLLAECFISYETIINETKQNTVFGDVKKENIHFIIFTNGKLPKIMKLKELNNQEVSDHLTINSFDAKSKPVQFDETYFGRCLAETFKDFAKRVIFQRGKSSLLNVLQEQFYGNKNANEIRDILVKASEQDIHKLLENEIIIKQFSRTRFEGFLKELILLQEQPDDENLSAFVYDEIVNMTDEESERVYDDMFKRLTRWHESSNIALTRNNFYQILQKSTNEEVPISKYFSRICFSENNYMPRTIFNDQGEKAVNASIFEPSNFKQALIFAADAGAGKSTIVNYLSQLYKNDMHIITIRLGKTSKAFENVEIYRDDYNSTCKEFLKHCLKYKNHKIYEEIMQFTKQQHFYILLDGYDEVICNGKYVLEKINIFIKTLVKKYNVMITTRKSYEDQLQNLISCNFYYIKNFDLKEQKRFAKNFFKNNVKGILNVCDKKLEKLIDAIFNISKIDEFLTIPLQLEMLLTSYLDNFSNYYDGVEDISFTPKFSDLFDFYSTFVERKIKIYLNRACLLQCPENIRNNLRRNIFADHVYYSMKLFNHLHGEEFKLFKPSLDYDELIQIGFISSISATDDRIVFVHNTFADFFYVYRVINHLERTKELDMTHRKMFIDAFAYSLLNSKFISNSLKLFNLDNDSIEIVNDNNKYETDLLGRNRFHIAIMNGLKNIITFSIQDSKCLNAKDLFGATPFLYAFTSNKVGAEIIKLMLKQKHCPISVPNKLQFTCLHYAIFYRSVEITSLLLNDPHCPINNQTKDFNLTPLHLAIGLKKIEHANALISSQKCNLRLVSAIGQTYLHIAVRMRSLEIVKLLLDANCECNIVDIQQNSALHYAAMDNDKTEIAKVLLNNSNSDISLTNKDNMTCLHFAARENNHKIIEILVQRDNCPFNIQTKKYKSTALHFATAKQTEKSVIILINSKKCNLDLVDSFGRTVLHFAVIKNSLEIVKLLLDANCECNIVDFQQNSALHFATMENDRTEIAKLLLNNSNSDISLTNIDNMTCLHFAARENNHKIIEILVQRDNCPFNIQTEKYKLTALHCATVKQADESAITLINSKKCNLDLVDSFGRTVLHFAVIKNSLEVVKLLLDANCECNIVDVDQNSALHFATMQNDRTEIAKLLLNNSNSDISLTNRDNTTCLHFAARENNHKIVEMLVQRDTCPFNIQTKKYKLTALHWATAKQADESAIILIISKKCYLDLADSSGRTCLHFAVIANSLEIVKLLLAANCECNIVDGDQNSALHFATMQNGRAEIAKLLINNIHCDISFTNINNVTCLHCAAGINNHEIIEILVKHDTCPFNIQTNDTKYTALHLAIANQAEESASILIKSKKCELNLIDFEGRTCLHWAVALNSPKIVLLLLAANCDYRIQDCDGKTACEIAYDENLTEIIKLFSNNSK